MKGANMKLRNKKTGSLLEINDEERNLYSLLKKTSYLKDWEEYIPKEPLIKDEKIRKAVRAWSEALDIENIHVFHEEDIYCIFRSEFSDLEIQFDGSYEEQIKDGIYTIAELCGEEK